MYPPSSIRGVCLGWGNREREENGIIKKIHNFSFIVNQITLLAWQQLEPKQQTQEEIQEYLHNSTFNLICHFLPFSHSFRSFPSSYRILPHTTLFTNYSLKLFKIFTKRACVRTHTLGEERIASRLCCPCRAGCGAPSVTLGSRPGPKSRVRHLAEPPQVPHN